MIGAPVASAAVAKPSPRQLAWRGRIEAGLHVAAPFLDLVLAVGERISRMVDRDERDGDDGPYTVQPVAAQRRVGPGR
jgi:hypothetical protein